MSGLRHLSLCVCLSLRLLFRTNPVITLKAGTLDEQRKNPAEDGKASEDGPRQRFTLGVNVSRQGEQTTRNEGSNASAKSGERLSNSIKAAEASIVGCRVGDLVGC